MTKRITPMPMLMAGAALALFGSGAAQAAPIVQDGSTYFNRIFDPGIFGISLNAVVFDGLDEVRVIDGRTLTAGESQTDLGDGRWEIRLSLLSDTDMAPGDRIFSRFGHGDAIDLLENVRLVSLLQTWTGFDPDGTAFILTNETAHILAEAYREPWNGAFGDPPSGGFGYVGIAGWDFRSVSYTAIVQRVPAPGTLLLSGLALLALGACRRR